MATRDLSKGMSGDDVTLLQKELNAFGYYYGTIDGDFGSVTDTAVRAFQRANGLYADGIVGPYTRAIIEGIIAGNSSYSYLIQGLTNSITADSSSVIAKYGQWTFTVSADLIKSFTSLKISASSELQDSENSNQGYASYKGANPTEVTFTVHLNAFTGCDVRAEAEMFATGAGQGWRDYLYIGGKKIFDSLLLFTGAEISNITLSPSGQWLSADVAITMKQCEATDAYIESSSSSSSSGSSSGSSGGSSGYSSGSSSSYSASTGSQKSTYKEVYAQVTGVNYNNNYSYALQTGGLNTSKSIPIETVTAANVSSALKSGVYAASTAAAVTANSTRTSKTTTTTTAIVPSKYTTK